jgi:hypothetical protein
MPFSIFTAPPGNAAAMVEHEELDDIEAAEREMEQDAEEMDEGVERLDKHIEEADRAAEQRPEVADAEAGDDDS